MKAVFSQDSRWRYGGLVCFWFASTLTMFVPASASSQEIVRGKTSTGVEYGLWGAATTKPAPLLIVLAGTIESTLAKPYFRQCGNELSERGYLCVSIDLPNHGSQIREGESSGLGGWSQRAAKQEDFVEPNNSRLSAVLDHLIKAGVADPQRIAACGTSRGGFLAIHFAAHDERVKCAAGFAPVTNLAALREFESIKNHPFVRQLSLNQKADRLAERPIWIVIGDQDERVGTHHAFALAQQLTKAAIAHKVASQVELHIMPEPRGHTTPRGSSEAAAIWIHRQLFGAAPSETK